MTFKILKIVAIVIAASVLLSACGGEPVVTSLKLSPLNAEQASRVDPSNLNIADQTDLGQMIVIVVDSTSVDDPTGGLTKGENVFRFASSWGIPMSIEETSTDGNAYVDVYQNFSGGTYTKYVFRVPAGETAKYIRLYEIGS